MAQGHYFSGGFRVLGVLGFRVWGSSTATAAAAAESDCCCYYDDCDHCDYYGDDSLER